MRVNATSQSQTPSRFESSSGGASVVQTVPLDEGRLLANAAFLPVLRAHGLDTFAAVMQRQGFLMRSVPGRSTVRLELPSPAGGLRAAYLKRYQPAYLRWWQWPLRWLRWPGAADEARHEWEMILALRRHGFRTAEPLAVGQVRVAGVVARSCLLTAEVAGGVAAHEYVRTLGAGARRAFARQVGDFTRRLHGAGFIHKDYYLNHILVVESAAASEAPALFLIDLQRMQGPGRFSRRWHVKDLAALGYSAQLAGATRPDLLAFYLAYTGGKDLSPADRRVIRAVLRRVAALHRRRPKYDVIWDQPGVRPPNV